jgi:hypothetical protein
MRHDDHECMRCGLFELCLIELLLAFERHVYFIFDPSSHERRDVTLVPRHVCCDQLHANPTSTSDMASRTLHNACLVQTKEKIEECQVERRMFLLSACFFF